MRLPRLLPALAAIAAASPALASPATSDGARQLEQGYADYLTRAVVDKGVVSVTPDGDEQDEGRTKRTNAHEAAWRARRDGRNLSAFAARAKRGD